MEKEKKRNDRFRNTDSKNGAFSCHIKKETNRKLTVYCQVMNINKTTYVNDLLEQDMNTKLGRLKMFGTEK